MLAGRAAAEPMLWQQDMWLLGSGCYALLGNKETCIVLDMHASEPQTV